MNTHQTAFAELWVLLGYKMADDCGLKKVRSNLGHNEPTHVPLTSPLKLVPAEVGPQHGDMRHGVHEVPHVLGSANLARPGLVLLWVILGIGVSVGLERTHALTLEDRSELPTRGKNTNTLPSMAWSKRSDNR